MKSVRRIVEPSMISLWSFDSVEVHTLIQRKIGMEVRGTVQTAPFLGPHFTFEDQREAT